MYMCYLPAMCSFDCLWIMMVILLQIWWTPLEAGYALNEDRLKTADSPKHTDGREEPVEHNFAIHLPNNWKPLLPVERPAISQGDVLDSQGSMSDERSIEGRMICGQFSSVFLLLIVKSACSHFSQRLAIRHTWGTLKQQGAQRVVTMFFLGSADDISVQESISVENTMYRDLVQVNTLDSYNNSALITQQMFQWIVQECADTTFVAVINDNVVVDVHKLLSNLYLQLTVGGVDQVFTVCYLFPCCNNITEIVKPLKLSNSTGGVYFGNMVPEFCAMYAYAASGKTFAKLYDMSKSIHPFVPEELWVSVLAQSARVTLPDTRSMFGKMDPSGLLLKQYLAPGYSSSRLIFGVIGDEYQNQEAFIVKNIWSATERHYSTSGRFSNKNVNVNVVRIQGMDSGDILYFAISFMFVDIIVIVCIVLVMCMKRKTRQKRHSYT